MSDTTRRTYRDAGVNLDAADPYTPPGLRQINGVEDNTQEVDVALSGFETLNLPGPLRQAVWLEEVQGGLP